jgi:hypothetical protein
VSLIPIQIKYQGLLIGDPRKVDNSRHSDNGGISPKSKLAEQFNTPIEKRTESNA